MFIPLGVGSRLKRIPFAIIAIAVVCVVWSVNFFPVIKSSELRLKSEMASKADANIKDAYSDLLKAACRVRGISSCEDPKNSKLKDTNEVLSQAGALFSLISELQDEHEKWASDIRRLPEYRVYANHVQNQRDLSR